MCELTNLKVTLYPTDTIPINPYAHSIYTNAYYIFLQVRETRRKDRCASATTVFFSMNGSNKVCFICNNL